MSFEDDFEAFVNQELLDTETLYDTRRLHLFELNSRWPLHQQVSRGSEQELVVQLCVLKEYATSLEQAEEILKLFKIETFLDDANTVEKIMPDSILQLDPAYRDREKYQQKDEEQGLEYVIIGEQRVSAEPTKSGYFKHRFRVTFLSEKPDPDYNSPWFYIENGTPMPPFFNPDGGKPNYKLVVHASKEINPDWRAILRLSLGESQKFLVHLEALISGPASAIFGNSASLSIRPILTEWRPPYTPFPFHPSKMWEMKQVQPERVDEYFTIGVAELDVPTDILKAEAERASGTSIYTIKLELFRNSRRIDGARITGNTKQFCITK